MRGKALRLATRAIALDTAENCRRIAWDLRGAWSYQNFVDQIACCVIDANERVEIHRAAALPTRPATRCNRISRALPAAHDTFSQARVSGRHGFRVSARASCGGALA